MNASQPILLEQHQQYLRARGIADDVALERGYASAVQKSELERLGFGRSQQLTPALVIPIWSVRRQVESYQLRPDQARLDDKGKPRKYEMKVSSRMLLDVHPRLTLTREGGKVPLIADPSVPLVITEGIPKADAAVSIGLCCLALLGVFNFRGSNSAGGTTALADWESVALNQRYIYIAFDSDLMLKPQVYIALVRLKAFLESRGAKVIVIYLPAGEYAAKVGLDDFIARQKQEARTDEEIREALLRVGTYELRNPESSASSTTAKPAITLVSGALPEAIDRAEEVLVANYKSLNLFQRAGEVVRVISIDRPVKRGGLHRPAGAVVLRPLTPTAMLDVLNRCIDWYGPGREGELIPKDCPSKVAQQYLARSGFWKLPALTGVVEAPTLRPDGTIFDEPGYDEATGLFLYSDPTWPDMPAKPTRRQAEDALGLLREPFSQFPFVGEQDLAVLIAAILTALERRLLPTAPIFGFSAPLQASGKSLLVDIVARLATGRDAPAAGVAEQRDEMRKLITSVLREGHLLTNLDNLLYPLDSPDLARAITQPVYADRLLGVNQVLRLLTNVLWCATGNNLAFKGDLPSRALLCRIDAQVERPEEREFEVKDLRAHVLEHRLSLVTAALTILRGYIAAGSKQVLKPFGRFDEWSATVREPLVWLGLPDPCLTRERIIASDPERDQVGEIFSLWREVLGERIITTHETIEIVGTGCGEDGDDSRRRLKRALLAVAAARENPEQIDSRRLGAWCRMNTDRIVNGLRLCRETGDKHHAATWRLTSSGSSGSSNGVARNSSSSEKVAACNVERPEFSSPNSYNSESDELAEVVAMVERGFPGARLVGFVQ